MFRRDSEPQPRLRGAKTAALATLLAVAACSGGDGSAESRQQSDSTVTTTSAPAQGQELAAEACAPAEDLPQHLEEARSEVVDFWHSKGIDLSGTVVVYVPDVPEMGCYMEPGDSTSFVHAPRYLDDEDTVVMAMSPVVQAQAAQRLSLRHEMGHSAQDQQRTLSPNRPGLELEADCLAGMSSVGVSAEEMTGYREAALAAGDDNSKGTHASGEARFAAITYGVEQGNCDSQGLFAYVSQVAPQA